MLKDISVRFDPVEDRLLLRLGSHTPGGDVDHWLHLTRRICSGWRKDLQAMVDLSAEVPQSLDAGAKAVVSASHHRALSQQVPARVETAPGPPNSIAPSLVTRVECGRRRSDGRWVLKFSLRDQTSLTLALSGPALHALVDALSHRVQGAGWGLAPIGAEKSQSSQAHPASPLH